MMGVLRCRMSAHLCEAMEGPLTLKEDTGKLWERTHHASTHNAFVISVLSCRQPLSGSPLYPQRLAHSRLETRVQQGMP